MGRSVGTKAVEDYKDFRKHLHLRPLSSWFSVMPLFSVQWHLRVLEVFQWQSTPAISAAWGKQGFTELVVIPAAYRAVLMRRYQSTLQRHLILSSHFCSRGDVDMEERREKYCLKGSRRMGICFSFLLTKQTPWITKCSVTVLSSHVKVLWEPLLRYLFITSPCFRTHCPVTYSSLCCWRNSAADRYKRGLHITTVHSQHLLV